MFGKKLPDNAPSIEDVSYLDHYNLFVTFDNGEQRIYDASNQLNHSPYAQLYKPLDIFKGFKFDYGGVYWGSDEDFGIMHDDIYFNSFPFSAIVSESGAIMSLSLAWVKNVTPFPIRRFVDTIRMYVHGRGEDRHHEPHVHVDFQNMRVPFKLDATPLANAPNPPFAGNILKALKQWMSDNLAKIAEVWNKENQDNPIDPITGKYTKK
jgi:hypothetical protein